MNFDEAIAAHSQWKIRLQSVLSGTSKEILDPATVGVDDRCALGQWIHGEAKAHASLQEYSDLVTEHAAFHRAAAEVLRLAESGMVATAAQSILEGHFHHASLRTLNAIRDLRRKVGQP